MVKHRVNILYNIEHTEQIQFVNKRVEGISERNGVDIVLDICETYELLEKLRNQRYDLVIIHLGLENKDAFELAENCRRISDTVLVAESAMFPMDEKDVEMHFNHYIEPLYYKMGHADNIENLLKKYGFI